MRSSALLFVALLGCHRDEEPRVPRTATVSSALSEGWTAHAEHAAAQKDATTSEKLVGEAVRQLRAVKSTQYKHKTHVDEANGVFEYDCSGFVAYALGKVAPDALTVIPVGKKRSQAEHFATYFAGITDDKGPWLRVARMTDVKPGDVIAWLRPAEVDNGNTGHIVIVVEPPKKIEASDAVTEIGGAAEWLVRVIDSTKSGHAHDARKDEDSGLGTGTIGVVVDGSDTPIGYRWKGGKSKRAFATMVAIGRLK
jgi:hypothetical protein